MNGGSCLCGDITWEVDGEFTMLTSCHCSMCRKVHGAAFATYVGTPAENFRYTAGEDKIATYESSPGGHRPFCPRCGSVLAAVFDGFAFMAAGNVDGEIGHELDSHIFVASKAPWHEITDSAPQFDGYPPGYDKPGVDFPAREPEREGATGGSCLCGAVAYEFDGPVDRFILCHCSRCRRSRSAAHSAQVFLPAERFRWLRGEEDIRRYQYPGAGFTPSFCSTCGSLMPRTTDSGLAIIPAGSLDQDPDGRPQMHIFVGSKAPWFEITDDLPQFREMPT